MQTRTYPFVFNALGFPLIAFQAREIDAKYAEFLDEQLLLLHEKEIDGEVLDFVFKSTVLPQGMILEFGVFSGISINRIADAYPDRQVFGFDSFEGFPEDWEGIPKEFSRRVFSCDMPAVRENVSLTKGWFNETLPKFLEEHPEPCALIHVDCDIYSSTALVLSLLKDRIRSGTVIVFDEMVNIGAQSGLHEMKAWWEFVRDSGIDYEWLGYGYDCGIEFTPAVLKFLGEPGKTPMEKAARKFGLPNASKVAVAVRVK